MCLIKEVQFFLILQEANRKPAAYIQPVSPSLLHTQAHPKCRCAASLTRVYPHACTDTCCGTPPPPPSPLPTGAAYHVPGFRRKQGSCPPLDEEEAVEHAVVNWLMGEKQSNSWMQINSSHRFITHLPADATGNYATEGSASGSTHKTQLLSGCFQPMSGNV